jgi:hypothetical protein
MKTSKSKSKPEKIREEKDAVKIRKNTETKSKPNEEAIRDKAKEIYLQRIDRGEHGTAENDWIEAEKYFIDSEE